MSEPLFKVIVQRGLAPSHGEARRLVRAGRVLVEGVKAVNEGAPTHESFSVELAR